MDAFRCGVAGDGDVVDTQAADKARFDRKRVNVASAADQHVVGAVAYGQPSFFIDFTEVASGQPAITAAVTGHDLRAVDTDKAVRAQREFIGAEWAANQAFTPQVAGQQRQMMVRGARCCIEIGVVRHDAARFALAAAG